MTCRSYWVLLTTRYGAASVTLPATLIWRFRLASLGGNAVLWGLLSVGFGLVVAEGRRSQRAPALADAPS